MTSRFDTCLNFTLDWEGRTLEFDPHDPGGVTFAGIDQRDHPGVDVRHLTLDNARDIYYDENWLKFFCEDLPYPWDLLVFDSSVNPGPDFPVRAMQDCLAVKVDGVLGPRTMSAANSNSAVTAPFNASIKCFLSKRYEHYAHLPWVLRRMFMEGWTDRTAALAEAVGLPKDDFISLVA